MRNTAPAIPATVLLLAESDPDAVMPVTPSDQIIPDAAGFAQAVEAALPAARDGAIVTFGITPIRAETGYSHRPAQPGPAGGPCATTHPWAGSRPRPGPSVSWSGTSPRIPAAR